MNQAVSFGFLFGGGILLTRALTGSSYADILKGHPGTVGTGGHDFGGVGSSGVAGVGTAVGNLTGANAAAVNAATGAGGINPVQARGVNVERIDQGRDFATNVPGGTIVSPTPGQIVATVPLGRGWEGGAAVVEHLASGAYQYWEEGVIPTVHAGQNVAQGQTIARIIPGFHAGVEGGFAAPTSSPGANYIGGGYTTLAQATTGYTEGEVTKAGQAFAAWLQSVGF